MSIEMKIFWLYKRKYLTTLIYYSLRFWGDNQGMDPAEEFIELFTQFATGVTEEMLQDPELAAIAAQVLQIIEPPVEMLSEPMVEQLRQIKDKSERFRQAAFVLGTFKPELLDKLAASMKAAGLLDEKDVEPELSE